jgi:hypothetical protein
MREIAYANPCSSECESGNSNLVLIGQVNSGVDLRVRINSSALPETARFQF